MTDNELLFIVNSKQYMNSRTPETPYFALRAVVELHKAGNGRNAKCVACAMQTMDCPTIKAIEKELV